MSDTAIPWERPQPVVTNFTAPFWEATRRKELVIQYCPVAKKYQHVPRPLSIYTGQRNIEWRPVSGRGHIYALTITRRAPPPFRGREPYVVATIQLAEGVRFMSNVVNCDPAVVRIGMPVRVAWDQLADGLFYPVFEPDPAVT
jgi:uncharacterized OB-fold protein